LNKVDLVDEEWLELMQAEVSEFLKKYNFEDVSVIPVSAISGTGIDQLQVSIEQKINELSHSIPERPFRLNIDRSFSAKGFGNIVTGTILSGTVRVGDQLHLLPSGDEVKIRGLQVHQKDADAAITGQRVAVNLSGIDLYKLNRGAVLVEPDSLVLCRELIAEVRPVMDLEFKMRRHMDLRVHLGTDELKAKMNWFGEDDFQDESAQKYIRLKLERPAVAAPGDAVLLRSFSPVQTLAGGKVLQINPPALSRKIDTWQPYVQALSKSDLDDIILTYLRHHGFKTTTVSALKTRLFLNKHLIESNISQLLKSKKISGFEYKNEQHYLLQTSLDKCISLITKAVEDEIQNNAFSKGLNQGEIENLIKKLNISEPFLFRALKLAVNRENLLFDGETYSTKTLLSSRTLSVDQEKVETYYSEARFTVLTLEQLSKQMEIEYKVLKNLTQNLAKSGILESVQGHFYIHKKHFDSLLSFLSNYFKSNEELSIGEVRDFTGSSRKYIVPLMEYLDNKNYTNRSGDIRTRGGQLR